MPKSASTVNHTLTNYARGIAQDMSSALANFLAPEVPVTSSTGQYKDYSDKNAFQVYDTSRAIGGPAKRIEFAASDPTYNCKPQALEIPIDDNEGHASGMADPLKVRQAKTRTLVSSTVLSHEAKVFTAVRSAVTAESGKGVWSNADVDPIEELDEQIEALSTASGMMPNRMVIGIGAWRILRNHPKVIARQPGAIVVGATTDQAASMMLNPSIDIRVGVLSRDTAKFGKGKAAENIVGAEVFIFYNRSEPTIYDPSFAKTFTIAEGGVDEVHEYRSDSNRSDIIAVDWSEDIKITSTALVRRITLS